MSKTLGRKAYDLIDNDLQLAFGQDLEIYEGISEALSVVKKIIDKDTPHKVHWDDPCTCGRGLNGYNPETFCKDCGQRLEQVTAKEAGKIWHIQKFTFDHWGNKELDGTKGPFKTLREAVDFAKSYWETTGGIASCRVYKDTKGATKYMDYHSDFVMIGDIIVHDNGKIESEEQKLKFVTINQRKAFKTTHRYVNGYTSYQQATYRKHDIDENNVITYFVDQFVYGAFMDCSMYDTIIKHIDDRLSNNELSNLRRIEKGDTK